MRFFFYFLCRIIGKATGKEVKMKPSIFVKKITKWRTLWVWWMLNSLYNFFSINTQFKGINVCKISLLLRGNSIQLKKLNNFFWCYESVMKYKLWPCIINCDKVAIYNIGINMMWLLCFKNKNNLNLRNIFFGQENAQFISYLNDSNTRVGVGWE